MKTNLSLLKKFCALALLLVSVTSFAQFRVIGYLPTWGGNLSDVQYTKLTHINYAFLIPNADGSYQAPSDPTRLNNLVSQAHANGVKVIISVGGGGGGDAFKTIVPNSGYRTAFVNNMVSFVNQYNLDGVDIDWEFPSDGTEANNFLLLMQQLSTAMHNNGKVLTAAVIAYGGTSFVNGLFSAVDFLNIMAYDENNYTHSTYDLGVQSVNYWVGRGLPANKAVLGVPFYGRNNCCSYVTVGYNDILAMGGSPNADTYNNQIGYNGIPTIKQKTAYAMQACGGIMIWSIDTDAIGANSLLSAINSVVVANSNPVPDNLAKGKAVTVSSTEASTTTSTVGSNATDGSYSTRWSSLFADPQWVSVDLGANYNVNRVKLTWEAAYATAYQIQISSDGSNWTNLKSVTGNATTTNDQTGLSGTGRYVRIYGTARATAYGYSLYEVEVYGTAIESPYSGTAITLPGKIEAENYDLGGQGLAYNDADVANQGGAYRTDGVDIQATTDVGGGYNVGYTADGEWMNYMVKVPTAGTYNFGFRTAGTGTTSAIRIEVDGAAVTGSIALPNTGGWQTWANTASPNITLSAGAHTIRLFTVTGGFNLNYVNVTSVVTNQPPTVSLTTSGTSFTAPASVTLNATAADADGTVSKVEFFNGTTLLSTSTTAPYSFVWSNVAVGTYSVTAKATDNSGAATTSSAVSITVTAPVIVETPYTGTAISIPGIIQAENYDNGGQGLAYNDADVANQGGAFRTTEGVDIETTTDVGGGYDVGYTAAGEWMKYMVNVTSAGIYNFAFRTAGTGTTSSLRLEIDGAVISTLALPNTGGWQTWTNTTASNITLSAGAHTIRLFTVTGGFNLNYVNVTANQAPSVSLSTSGTSFTTPASVTLSATAADVDGTVSKVEFYNGTNLLSTSTTAPYSFVWSNVAVGSYSVTAKATDNSGASTTSSAVSIKVTAPVETPYGGTAATLPGTIQAENYDNGGEGIAYHDIDAANQGGSYRTTDGVDIEATTDIGGGYNIGYTADGEWTNYTVNVTVAGTYDVSFRTAATSASSVIRMDIDGSNATGSVSLPNTGAWQTWSTTTVSNIAFTAGTHIVRLFTVTGGFNLNSVTVSVHSTNTNPGFLHASGKNIVNDKGNFIIKAVNIGDFMVQEGYMMNLGGSQHIYRQKIADMVGTAARDQFYANYYANFITKADIDSIAKWGFNTIRLPMHYALFTPLGQPDVFLDQGFTIVDNILGWCKANNIYVILDLHAAPGGENSGDISDYDSSMPSLWESAANRDQTVKLWSKLASRYVNEQYIGGYDLINETNWTLANNNQLLAQLMKDITTAIRQVDNNHIVYIEGNSYANDYNGLTPKWDNNMVYSFHKYWNDDSQGSLNFVLAIRDGQNVPIWMGEFGENSNNWIADAVTLMNQNGIGWAIWPYKKMSSVSSISSFNQPSNWSVFADYVNGGAKPSAANGQAILNELLENVKVSNCKVNKGYLYALFQQPGNTNTAPYTSVSLPGRISAANYDEGKNGYAYNDAAFQNTQYGSTVGSSTSWNTGWYYRNDGVDLQFSNSENGPTVGWTENGDWMQYTVNITVAGSYSVKVRAAGNGGTLSLSSDGTTLINSASIPSTGGWDTWQTITLGNVNLAAGTHKLIFTINTAGYNLNYFDFANASSSARISSTNTSNDVAVTSILVPNPTTGIFTIALNNSFSVQVLNGYGLEVMSIAELAANGSIDITGLAAGVYLVKINSGGDVITQKIIKQ